MKNLADKIKDNPHVTDFQIKPKVGTIIIPTYTRKGKII